MQNFPDDFRFQGYTERQLRDAFEAVADPENWKMPISARIKRADIAVTAAAIVFYAGSNTDVFADPQGDAAYCVVAAAGYYVSVGA